MQDVHLCQAQIRLPPLALKPRGDITTSRNRGIKWPHKNDLYPANIFLKEGSSFQHTLHKFNDGHLEENNVLNISLKVSATFTSQLMSNHTTKMTDVPIEINGNLYFSQISHG